MSLWSLSRMPSLATMGTGSMLSLQSDQSGLLMKREPTHGQEEEEDVADGEMLQVEARNVGMFLTVPGQHHSQPRKLSSSESMHQQRKGSRLRGSQDLSTVKEDEAFRTGERRLCCCLRF